MKEMKKPNGKEKKDLVQKKEKKNSRELTK